MSSTTGEHINELEERRQRRQQRNAAQPGPAKPPRSANTAAEARDLLRDLITNGSRPDEGAAAHPDAGSVESDGGQQERFDRDREQAPTVGSSKRRRGRRARSARASRRPDRGRRGRTRDSAEVALSAPPTCRPTRQPGPQRDGEPAALPSTPFRAGSRRSVGRLGGRGCHRPHRRRRPCAVVGLRGRTPDCRDSQHANLGDGCRPRVRRADTRSATGRRELEALTASSNRSGPSRPACDQARARPTASASRANDASPHRRHKASRSTLRRLRQHRPRPRPPRNSHPQAQAGRQQAGRRPVLAAPNPQARPTRARSAGSAPASAAAPKPTKDVMSSPSDPTCRDLLSSSAERVRAGCSTVELEEAPDEHRNGT